MMTCLVAYVFRINVRAHLITSMMLMMMSAMQMRAVTATVLHDDHRNFLNNRNNLDKLHGRLRGDRDGRHGAHTTAALGTELSRDEGEACSDEEVKVHFMLLRDG